MASNYKTTNSSISLGKSNQEYRIWVCYLDDVCKLDIQDNDIILNWNNSNQYPILVYREVRIKDKGLKKLENLVNPDELSRNWILLIKIYKFENTLTFNLLYYFG